MLSAIHWAVAVIAGAAARTRWHGFALGVGTHFVLDYLHHEEPTEDIDEENIPLAAFDVALTLVLGVGMWRWGGLSSVQLAAGLGGVLPDVEHLFPWNRGENLPKRVFPTHLIGRHFHSKLGPHEVSLVEQLCFPVFLCSVMIGWRAFEERELRHG